ncbi:MAG: hypothetical protein C4567_00020 [Deltaproteobacteria bacterium]|nr:MAG: hypothetical protein C4567_00020 [Deltaproteobacteria bacterium]
MKKTIFLAAAVLFLAMVAITFAGNPKPVFTVGQEVYACNCGEQCDCFTMAKKPGKCVCGKEMVKAKVTAVEKGKVTLQGEGWEKPRTFLTDAKYACACGHQCDCDTISQKPGKCVCGKEMAPVKK